MAQADSAQEVLSGQKETSTAWKYLTWSFASPEKLKTCEEKILSYIKRPLRRCHVNLENGDKIWTLTAIPEEATNKTPLVMLHGMGSALGFWVMNLDEVGQDRPVYAIDILGFGRSSRSEFTGDAMEVEKQFVRSIEKWRQTMGLEKMILLGHSMGGYLAASYAIDFPDRIQHLIFADAWGFPEPSDRKEYTKFMPRWVQIVERVFKPNPMVGIRAAGPWGPQMIKKIRSDIVSKFEPIVAADDIHTLAEYFQQCNIQKPPTGEIAFRQMLADYGYAKNPMIRRIQNGDIRKDLNMTLIYGGCSWVDSTTGELIRGIRAESFVDVKIVEGAGHHLYADQADVFNQFVREACADSDRMEREK